MIKPPRFALVWCWRTPRGNPCWCWRSYSYDNQKPRLEASGFLGEEITRRRSWLDVRAEVGRVSGLPELAIASIGSLKE